MKTKSMNYGLNSKQRLFVGYTLATLVDLCVLSFLNEYWDYVTVSSFSVAFVSAILLQALMKSSIQLEHKIAAYFAKKEGGLPKVLRAISSYIVLVGSKFLMLEVLNIFFGDKILFSGPWNGVIAFIVVVFAMLLTEKIVGKIYFILDDNANRTVQVN